ncbi:MAG: magnesium-translocating P-type ATPase [Erysipelotrichaceae bacterium]|nr:magnesium-translocating P-type ATPase [Erysipelotrichaceae bacterium]
MARKNNNTDSRLVEKKLEDYALLNKEELFERFEIDNGGLSTEQVAANTEKYGKNIINQSNENTLIIRLKDAIINPFNIVLLAVSGVTYFTDVVLAEKASYATFAMLLIIVAISSAVSFIQSEKSNNAARQLQKMISNNIEVIRNGYTLSINIEDAVPGDIVKLGAGDMVPGDVRFYDLKDLFIDQSQLTGESVPVEKFTDCREHDNITELSNIGFMGSNIVSGSAKAVILSTGNYTYFGSMAKSLSSEDTRSTFDENMDSISRLLIRFMFVMIPVIFIANLLTKNNWLDSLMFGITIAVGLMPEMLPVIMTSSLAKGAITMSKKKTIVKRLGAIQTFGEMDVLCTDKTGTLTEDKVILEKYLNARGEEDIRVLSHAFLNSYFQTGMKNLMDRAIIARGEKEGLNRLKREYVREDEIPFDFQRRMMSVVMRDKNIKRQLITKGAVEEVISRCRYVDVNGQAEEINDEWLNIARKVADDNGREGIRVIAVAQKNDIHDVDTFGIDDEKDLVLLGFIGFLDPPKESAKPALDNLKKSGIRTVVLTGDSEGVAIAVSKRLGIDVTYTYNGAAVDKMSDEELKEACDRCYVFAKLNPMQKKRIVDVMQQQGHTVGYMGDGINDSPPLKQADVGISVDTAVDIAKEVADIILLEKDLQVLEDGVMEGRKTFANMNKYLKMAISGNFGNMLSVVIASLLLPFLPLKPVHILVQNILNDFAQLGMPFDNVEPEYVEKPKKWNVTGIRKFMVYFGLLSTVLDVLCFGVLWFVFRYDDPSVAEFFQCGWFMFGVISQTMVIHTIRTHKIPFIGANASLQLYVSNIAVVIITLVIGMTDISGIFDMGKVPGIYGLWMLLLLLIYLIMAQIMKKIYIKVNKEWI